MVVEADAGAQVRRILESKAFRTSEVHRNLLNYLAEKSLSGDADSLKEYTVGLDVFAKPSSYDPRQESVVRMHMARLRQKLAEYYRTEGAEDSVIVNLPKGGFKVTFDLKQLPPEPEPQLRQAPASTAAELSDGIDSRGIVGRGDRRGILFCIAPAPSGTYDFHRDSSFHVDARATRTMGTVDRAGSAAGGLSRYRGAFGF